MNKRIEFTDGFKIGVLKLKGKYDLALYPESLIKRVRLLKRADGYYVQFCVSVERAEDREPTQKAVGLDVGLESFYTDSTGHKEPNPRFLRKAEQRLKRAQRGVSRKQKGSKNRLKAKNRLGRQHLKVSRQRKDHAVKTARCVMMSNDVVAYEDLRVKNMVKNHHLAKNLNPPTAEAAGFLHHRALPPLRESDMHSDRRLMSPANRRRRALKLRCGYSKRR